MPSPTPVRSPILIIPMPSVPAAPPSHAEPSSASLSHMKGGGHYNQNSSMQGAAVSAFEPFIWEAVGKSCFSHEESIDGEDAAPIVVVDYGSCEGFNSLSPIA